MASAQPKIPGDIREVVEKLAAAGHRAFVVGGSVRDALLGRKAPEDFDLATSARPEQVQAIFPKVIPTGIDHGTVTVLHKGHHVEVTTFRSESDYADGRRPKKVEFHTDIEADLARRDFTINAMAFDPSTGELVDPFGGQADLEARLVRCVRDANERFSEDGLRALRAVRFATVLDFQLEPATFAAIAPTVPVFQKVAAERVREEFQKILLSPHAERGLVLLKDSGLAAAFLPEVSGKTFAAVGRCPSSLDVRLAALLDESPEPGRVVERLKFPSKTIATAAHLARHRDVPGASASDADVRRWLSRVGLETYEAALAAALALGRDDGAAGARIRAIAATRPPLGPKDLALDGREIMQALGVGPSPAVGQATRALVQAVLEDPSKNTPEQLRALLSSKAP